MITRDQLLVGVTYTDISNDLRTIVYIDTKFVQYTKEDGITRTTHLEVILDVLTIYVAETEITLTEAA